MQTQALELVVDGVTTVGRRAAQRLRARPMGQEREDRADRRAAVESVPEAAGTG